MSTFEFGFQEGMVRDEESDDRRLGYTRTTTVELDGGG